MYFPAILLPILDIEKMGHHHTASLLGGTLDLIRHGSLLVGLVVLVFSILLPLVKLLALLELSRIGLTHRQHRAWIYRVVEWTGRWSMMDLLLLALLVTLVKLGEILTFHIGPALVAFVMCVFMSMIASIMFDPHETPLGFTDGQSQEIRIKFPAGEGLTEGDWQIVAKAIFALL